VKKDFDKGNHVLFESAVPPSTWRLRKTTKTLQEGRWEPAVIQTGYLPNKNYCIITTEAYQIKGSNQPSCALYITDTKYPCISQLQNEMIEA
jgi:hypothetical protein